MSHWIVQITLMIVSFVTFDGPFTLLSHSIVPISH